MPELTAQFEAIKKLHDKNLAMVAQGVRVATGKAFAE